MIEPESGQVPLFGSMWQPAVDFTNQESPDMYEDVDMYDMDFDIAGGLAEDDGQ